MKNNGISTLKIAGTYIGTVVGAGFATGQEILQFFAAFGIRGLWGILLTTVLFILFGIVIMELGYTFQAQSHLEVIKQSSGKIFATAMDIIISFFLFGSLTAMIAGTGALFAQQFGLSSVLGNMIMAVITALTVLSGKNGVINAISAVVPFLLVSVIGISIFSILKSPPVVTEVTMASENGFIGNWVMAAILYTSYNTVISIAVLGPLGASANNQKDIVRGSILGGLGLGIGSVMIYLAVCANSANIRALEVPMTYIAGTISTEVQMVYAVILIAEVYTTAVGSLYGFAGRMAHRGNKESKERFMIIGSTIAAFFASQLGFSNLVKYLYPLVGYAGILLLTNLLYRKIRSLHKGRIQILWIK